MTSITGFSSVNYEAGEAVGVDSNHIWQLTATAAITKGTFVAIAAGGPAAPQGATVASLVGIALADIASGSEGPVLVEGIGTVIADATGVSIGAFVKPDASGHASAAAYGDEGVVGIACNASGAGGAAVIRLMHATHLAQAAPQESA